MTSDPAPNAADLLTGRTFVVTAIGGAPALASPTAEVTFGADGRVSGRATVNRINGAYRCEGDELLCGPLATTMMAGAPEAMVQEQELLAVLGAPLVVRAREDGIALEAADGRSLALREQADEGAVL